MNALEFFANADSYSGYKDDGGETTIRLPSEKDQIIYFHNGIKNDGNFYEYLILAPKYKIHDWFYSYLVDELKKLSDDGQYQIIQRMRTMEIEFEAEITHDESNGRCYINSATSEKYPLYSVRGTCHMEQECKCDSTCCKVHDEPCCFNKKVGISRTSSIKYPEYYEILPELVIWMAVCPDLDAVYVLHEDYPYSAWQGDGLNFPLAFLLKDNKITYVNDSAEVKRLYEEYDKKYPYDTSEIEEEMKFILEEPDFHF